MGVPSTAVFLLRSEALRRKYTTIISPSTPSWGLNVPTFSGSRCWACSQVWRDEAGAYSGNPKSEKAPQTSKMVRNPQSMWPGRGPTSAGWRGFHPGVAPGYHSICMQDTWGHPLPRQQQGGLLESTALIFLLSSSSSLLSKAW